MRRLKLPTATTVHASLLHLALGVYTVDLVCQLVPALEHKWKAYATLVLALAAFMENAAEHIALYWFHLRYGGTPAAPVIEAEGDAQ